MDAFRSARLDVDVAADSSTKIPNFDALSRRRTNRRVIAGAVLALGLMIPTAASLLTSNDSPTQLVAEKGKAKKKPAKKKKVVKKAPATTAPQVVVPVVSNTGAAAELGLSATETIRADQGFRSKRDGFGFPNYGGVPTDDSIDTTVMVALFGKANVCADPTAATCVELPGATDVKNQLNDALAAGRCEGFATLSQRFFDGIDQRPNGAKETGAVARCCKTNQLLVGNSGCPNCFFQHQEVPRDEAIVTRDLLVEWPHTENRIHTRFVFQCRWTLSVTVGSYKRWFEVEHLRVRQQLPQGSSQNCCRSSN
jgi:hypothetical protein